MAKRRRLLPALRGLEQKSLYTFGTGRGVIPTTLTTYGIRDRAAGWDMNAVIEDGYERVVWVFKAVEVIAGNASRLPFKITGEDTEVENHPLLRVMNKQANPLETGRAFRKRLSAQILLSKRGAFVEVTKNNAGQITRLDLLPPDQIRIVPDPHGDYILYYEFTRYDGEVRNIPPERIRWIREPHPIDPYSGVTPLEAAGMSAELDHLARAYNVSFINRDGRPGGILGFDADGIDEDEMARILDRLKPGPQYAGQITPIGTGPNGMTYIDTSAKPRDMAYETTSEKAKKEILAAFGVPESLAGNAADRTFDNASEEKLTFWHETMLPHLELIASAFDGDVDDDLDCGYNTEGIEALELPARRRREEKRQEWDKGLITLKEYREEAEYEEIDNAHTRALWVSPAKSPIPTQRGDAAALGLQETPGQEAAQGGAAPGPEAQTAHDVVQQAFREGAHVSPEGVEQEHAGPAEQAVLDARHEQADPTNDGAAAAAVIAAVMEGKSLHDDTPNTYDPGDEESRRVELAVAAALDAMLARQAGVIAARLEAPKTRKGTAYWIPDSSTDAHAGDQPIDADKVVDKQRWLTEMQDTLAPIATPAGQQSADGLLSAMAATGALTVAMGATAPVLGRVAEAPKATAEQISKAAAQAAIAPTMLALTIAVGALEEWLTERVVDLNDLAAEGRSLPELIEATKKLWADKARAFSDTLACTVAQTVVGGARDAAVEGLVPNISAPPAGNSPNLDTLPEVLRFWRTRDDERVRASHQAAEGQVRRVGDSFDVGGYPLRFPSDPLGPPSQVRNCRCWLRYEWPAGATFRLATGEAEAA